MALIDINQRPKATGGGGGLFGKIAGGIVGGIAGLVASGGNPMGAVAGASAGSALGGMAGGAIDPVKVKGGKSVPLQAMSDTSEVRLAKLVDAQKALADSTEFSEPEKAEITNQIYQPAIQTIQQKLMANQQQKKLPF